MKKLLPVIMLLIGVGGGIGAGIMTAPAPEADGQDPKAAEHAAEEEQEDEEAVASEFVRLEDQFVVPVIKGDTVVSMVVLTLSLETDPGMTEKVFSRQPKLRDLFLRVLFDHANMGGFRGSFTQSDNMDLLRSALREVARKDMGESIRDVLIVNIGRQDV